MMMFALPSSWLYSGTLQATGPNAGATVIDGTPPPGQTTFCQTSNARPAMALAVARSTFLEAPCCIEYETQNCGHQIGIPVGQPVIESIGQSLPHDVVRQNASAVRGTPTSEAMATTSAAERSLDGSTHPRSARSLGPVPATWTMRLRRWGLRRCSHK